MVEIHGTGMSSYGNPKLEKAKKKKKVLCQIVCFHISDRTTAYHRHPSYSVKSAPTWLTCVESYTLILWHSCCLVTENSFCWADWGRGADKGGWGGEQRRGDYCHSCEWAVVTATMQGESRRISYGAKILTNKWDKWCHQHYQRSSNPSDISLHVCAKWEPWAAL